jgi:hypothetical protein
MMHETFLLLMLVSVSLVHCNALHIGTFVGYQVETTPGTVMKE